MKENLKSAPSNWCWNGGWEHEISFPEEMNFKKWEKRKKCLKMEILKTQGEPDRILMKNVVYKIDDLRERCKYENNYAEKEKCPYTTLFYKQSPSGKELFNLPTMLSDCKGRKLFLLPKKITGDAVFNADLEIESMVCKLVWKDKYRTIPFNDWLEKTEEKLQALKKLEEKMKPLQKEFSELHQQRFEIEEELKKCEFMDRSLRY